MMQYAARSSEQRVECAGDAPDWRYYEISKMIGLQVQAQSFANARIGYKRGDKRMSTIYAQI